MKQKLSITIDEKKIKAIEKLLEDSKFRSKSHILEYSLEKFLAEELNNTNKEIKNPENKFSGSLNSRGIKDGKSI